MQPYDHGLTQLLKKGSSSLQPEEFDVQRVGPAIVPTPLRIAGNDEAIGVRFRDDDDRVQLEATFSRQLARAPELSFERAGPRAELAFDPAVTTAAIVTCGGLCPGLNDVIRGLARSLLLLYNVRRVLGFRYGYAGLCDPNLAPIELTPALVSDIHKDGGTMLGSSRGFDSVPGAVDTLIAHGVDILFTLGGDGTQRGAHDIHQEIVRRGARIAVVGIPKTVDNDVAWVDQTFGFDTAVMEAARVVDAVHVEARSARRGIGLVKLMGRDAGFIAAYAAIASGDADVVLIPEIGFDLPRLLDHLGQLLDRRGHATVVVAEGAGQHCFDHGVDGSDMSGNRRYQDIGLFLKQTFTERLDVGTVKYVDPSYLVRSSPANAFDSIYCMRLAHNAVHAAMAGKTDMLVGRWYNKFTNVPLPLVTNEQRRLNPRSSIWRLVLENTGQPCLQG